MMKALFPLLALSLGLACCSRPGAPVQPVVVYCAAGLKGPVEEAAKAYEAEFKVPVSLQFGGSQTLLANLEITKTGDLFIPADDSYLDMARQKKLVQTSIPLAMMKPLLVVAKGNPKGLKGVEDLKQNGIRLALTNPEAAAIGKVCKEALGAEWDALAKQAAVMTATVNEAGNAMKTGAADASFLWDSLLKQYPEVQPVPLPQFENRQASVSVALLTSSKQEAAAMKFARFLAAKDKGLPMFEKAGFKVAEGDPWAETPELHLFAGSMLKPAIEETLTAFEKREGVSVSRVYNGCGILVAQMKAGQQPDAYFACDVEFMNQVVDLFNPPEELAQNELVILVQKGNPKGVKDLRDLGKEGLRVGIGHEKQCAMGWLTQRTFNESGVTDAVMKNVSVQTPTGDMLVNQMQTGSLDAAVTYLSNAVGAGDKLDALRIQGLKCSVATQPFAVAKTVQYKQLAERLHAALKSSESQERFTSEGFQWKGR